jgi:hypothetical protein
MLASDAPNPEAFPMHPVLRCAILLWPAALLADDAKQDWAVVTALDRGPAVPPKSAAEATMSAFAHTDAQEKALRAFLADHPDDEHVFEALLRLARLLDLRAEMKAEFTPPEAAALMAKAAELATTPARRTEVEFTVLTRKMRTWRSRRPPIEERRRFLDLARTFASDHPGDRRSAWLLAETASMFDFEPATKERLLDQAETLTKDPALLAQIADDLRRLRLLGKPIPLRFTALDGRRIDVRQLQGKVVAIIFFATWSPPSTAAFLDLQRVTGMAESSVELIAFSLDAERTSLETFLRDNSIKSPVGWDGKGWDSPLLQPLAINAVPTAWLLDAKGILRSLDALEDPAAQLRRLLQTR